MKIKMVIAFVLLLAGVNLTPAQTTEFTYQGRLLYASLPANGTYDLEFKRRFILSSGFLASAAHDVIAKVGSAETEQQCK